eukprot:3684355-Amphidinium_carterae.1
MLGQTLKHDPFVLSSGSSLKAARIHAQHGISGLVGPVIALPPKPHHRVMRRGLRVRANFDYQVT